MYLRMKNHIFGYANKNLERIVGNKLLKADKTLSIAESCTGGLLADRVTDIPGSSRYFKLSDNPSRPCRHLAGTLPQG